MKRTPLERKSALRRKARLRGRNPDRAKKRFEAQYHSGEFVAWVHSLPCIVPGCRRRDIEAAHVVKRSRGLERSTWRCVVPLCHSHHREQEGRNEQFEARYGVDLEALARAVAQRWGARER